jgi:hypothetical protein
MIEEVHMEQQSVPIQPPLQVIEQQNAVPDKQHPEVRNPTSPAYKNPDDMRRLNARDKAVLWGRERARRSRVGLFLYIAFADAGVRSAAAMAASLEPGAGRRRRMMQQMLDNWRNARSQLERGVGLWG